ncbi:MAG: AAA family ATPase [Bacteroidia bacterium]|nr:AAA family ATPase [Bacteroidia bacterium]
MDLAAAESAIAQFRSNRLLVDEGFQSISATETLKDIELERENQALRLENYQNIRKYLDTNKDVATMPASFAISDMTLNALLHRLLELNQQKAALNTVATERMPQMIRLNSEIANSRKSVLDYLTNNIQAVQTNLQSLNRQLTQTNSRMKQLPVDTKEVEELDLAYQYKREHYQFLLNAKAEAEIGLATNAPDCRIVDKAKMVGDGPVSPNKKLIYFMALFASIAIPMGLVIMGEYFNNKIQSKLDIARITSIPLLATIVKDDRKNKKDRKHYIAVVKYPNSFINESFRSLCIKIDNLNIYSRCKTVGITSSTVGEGKTFCAVNLSAIYAAAGNRTLLISADLYKPQFSQYFDLALEEGLSDFLNEKCGIEDIIQPSEIKDLDVIVAGTRSLTPSKLLSGQRIGILMGALKQKYDYIIVDTPPIGFYL